MDSVRVNDWVSNEILSFPHPFHVKYELFLNRTGKEKISKSGNVITPRIGCDTEHRNHSCYSSLDG